MSRLLNGVCWVRFESNVGTFGIGSLSLRNGWLTGGDGEFRYRGFVVALGGCHRGQIAVERIHPTAVSLFGPVERFELVISGMASRNQFEFSGKVKGAEHLRLRIHIIPAMRMAAE